MKILIINYTDGGGGGALAPKRLFEELRNKNIDVDFGVVSKNSENTDIILLKKEFSFLQKIKRKFLQIFQKIIFRSFTTTNGILHSVNLWSLIDIDRINKSNYDLIHLHWIAGNSISIKDISKIKKPIIWTLHDSWAVCGAEHHPNLSEDDNRYITGYTKENKPRSTKGFDICRWIFNKKKKYLKKTIQFIGPSNWQTNLCKDSFIFKSLPNSTVQCIPNLLDRKVFKPINNEMSKNIFNIDTNKIVLGFSTPYFSDPKTDMKGSGLLIEVLNIFFETHNIENYVCLLVGNINNQVKKIMPKVHCVYTGFIENPNLMNLVYNACDVLLFPSKIENLPYGCLEPQSSGIPVVAFNTGGISDIVKHKHTGYLANCFDTEDFAKGIEYCIDNKDVLSKNAIENIKVNFNIDDAVNKHIEIYKTVYNDYIKNMEF